ncbi:MAG: hypothetical protein N2257_09995 [Thermodesulfovibrionales bacterium]|nr:hypothetical protein [Thermodesulfovibrionales bacterium]
MDKIMKKVICIILFLYFSASCGGGGVNGDYEFRNGNGWVTIEYPTTEPTFSTNDDSIYLSGRAFISPTHWRCCSGSAEDTGVKVTWENKTTNQGGDTYQSVQICNFLGTPYLCNHRWSATVPLVYGNNYIVITAIDLGGLSGKDSITVKRE